MQKNDFPIFTHNPDLVYLDTAASAQKPQVVLDKMTEVMTTYYANVHRGTYLISEKVTSAFERSRQIVADFIHARPKDIIFVRGATEGLNLIAQTLGRTLEKGDEVLISQAEHHANLVPWQLLSKQMGITLKYIRVDETGLLDMDDFKSKLSDKTKLVSVTHMSNVLGSAFPVKDVSRLAHQIGAKVLIDGCQAIAHLPIDVSDIGCDFYAFSGHKIYGPTGIGVLYAKAEIMNGLDPWQCGGDMIKTVSYEKTQFADTPARFEAGTPAIVEAIALGTALEYVQKIGYPKLIKNEKELLDRLVSGLDEIGNVQYLGDVAYKSGLAAFNIKGMHPQDVSMILGEQNVAIRVGHHCAQPITEKFGVSASLRVSFGLYNEAKDVDCFLAALQKAKRILL